MDIAVIKSKSEEASRWLKTIAHPDRLLILCQLAQEELCVGDLLKSSELSQSAFSQHLALLRENAMVKTRKESQTVYYSLADTDISQLIGVLHDIFCS